MSVAEDKYNRHFAGIPVTIFYYDTDEIFAKCHSINKAAGLLGCNSGRIVKCLTRKPEKENKKALSITSSRGKFYIKYSKIEKDGKTDI